MQTKKEILQDFELKRLIGEYPISDPKEGPALLITAGIHGNEPGGIIALNRIFKKLESEQIPIRGRIIGITGNLKALRKGVRYLDKDLNRICTSRRAARLRQSDTFTFEEESEFKELLTITDSIRSNPLFTVMHFMDLHTTSSNTTPYISVNKRKNNYDFAKNFPLPVVRGIEAFIPNHFDHYLSLLGHIGFTLEAGQHEDEVSIERHEAVIWLALEQAGLITSSANVFANESKRVLDLATSSSLGNYEVFYRFNIAEEKVFKMKAGYKNFQKVMKGEHIANYDGMPVYAEEDAFIFLPLYQQQGSDGFFLIRPCE